MKKKRIQKKSSSIYTVYNINYTNRKSNIFEYGLPISHPVWIGMKYDNVFEEVILQCPSFDFKSSAII